MFFTGEHFIALMSYMKECCRAAGCNCFEQIKNLCTVVVIKSVTRFVEYENRRTLYCSPQNKNCALLAVAETAEHFVFTACEAAESKPFHRRGNFDIRRLFVQTD